MGNEIFGPEHIIPEIKQTFKDATGIKVLDFFHAGHKRFRSKTMSWYQAKLHEQSISTQFSFIYEIMTQHHGDVLVGILGTAADKGFVALSAQVLLEVDCKVPNWIAINSSSHTDEPNPIVDLILVDEEFKKILSQVETYKKHEWRLGGPIEISGELFLETNTYENKSAVTFSSIPIPTSWRNYKDSNGQKRRHLGFYIQPQTFDILPRIKYYLQVVNWDGSAEDKRYACPLTLYWYLGEMGKLDILREITN